MASSKNYGRSGWKTVDWHNTERGFQRALMFDLAPKVEKEIANLFIEMQESFLRDLPAQEAPMMPFITGNLHDSIGAVTSVRGRVIRASYTDPVAKKTSSKTGKRIFRATRDKDLGRRRIVGSLEAFNMVKSLQGKYPQGLATMLFVAVPYAENPQERGRHAGYLDELRRFYVYAVDSIFREAAKRHILTINGSVDDYVKILYGDEDTRFSRMNSNRRDDRRGGYMGASKPGMSMKIH